MFPANSPSAVVHKESNPLNLPMKGSKVFVNGIALVNGVERDAPQLCAPLAVVCVFESCLKGTLFASVEEVQAKTEHFLKDPPKT
ncbi:hypothetical protein TNCV_1125711 [Trichonephila clavipes]|nr:hypothetical protein TNCV_1125711 [Trichonephila clavipes]